jgi:hypothetical protein
VLRTRTSRAVIAGALALGVAGLLVLPAEHLHLAGLPAGHHAHRHFAPHHQPVGGAVLDPAGGEDVRWLDTPSDAPRTAPRVAPVAARRGWLFAVEPPAREARLRAASPHPSTHDPPLTSHGLRAPPALLPL